MHGGYREDGQPTAVNLDNALKRINALPFRPFLLGGRYLEHENNREISAWIDKIDGVSHLRFAAIRRGILPHSENDGTLRGLDLPSGSGLVEFSHMCIFTEDNIAGVEYNYHAPRPSQLQKYLKTLAPQDCPSFKFEPLLERSAYKSLQKGQAIRKLKLYVRSSYIEVIEQANHSLGAAFRAASTASRAECVGLILGPNPYERKNLASEIGDSMRRLLGRHDFTENIRFGQITTVDEMTKEAIEFDLLKDEFVFLEDMMRSTPGSNVLDAEDVYSKIENIYITHREELQKSASISVDPRVPEGENHGG
ncbi:hypothetical protein [Actinocorallia libanotica]